MKVIDDKGDGAFTWSAYAGSRICDYWYRRYSILFSPNGFSGPYGAETAQLQGHVFLSGGWFLLKNELQHILSCFRGDCKKFCDLQWITFGWFALHGVGCCEDVIWQEDLRFLAPLPPHTVAHDAQGFAEAGPFDAVLPYFQRPAGMLTTRRQAVLVS